MKRLRLSPGARILFLAVLGAGSPLLASVLSSVGAGMPVESPGARSMGMGGLSIAVADDRSVETLNPAALHRIHLTHLSIQYVSDQSRYGDASGSAFSAYSNFNGFTFAMPLGRGAGVSAGLAPWTRMDFRLVFDHTLDGESY